MKLIQSAEGKKTPQNCINSIFTQNTNDTWLTQRQLMFRASNLELEWGITWCRELPVSSWKCPESDSCPDFINFTSTRNSSFKSNPKMNNSGLKEGWSLAGGSVTWKYDGKGFKKGQWSQQRGVPWSGVHYMETWRERFRKGKRTYTRVRTRAHTHTHTCTPHPTYFFQTVVFERPLGSSQWTWEWPAAHRWKPPINDTVTDKALLSLDISTVCMHACMRAGTVSHMLAPTDQCHKCLNSLRFCFSI